MRNRLILAALAVLVLGSALLAAGQTNRPSRETVRDPVCGLMVEKNPELSAEYNNRTYYFCLRTDRDAFKKNPGKYVR